MSDSLYQCPNHLSQIQEIGQRLAQNIVLIALKSPSISSHKKIIGLTSSILFWTGLGQLSKFFFL